MIVRLIVRDVIYDELTIVVRGDNSGDGFVTSVDIARIKNHINETPEDIFEVLADDVSKDGFITSVDTARIKNHISDETFSLN